MPDIKFLQLQVDVKARCHKCDQNGQTLQGVARFPCKVDCWKISLIYSLVNLCHFGINCVYSSLSNYEWVSPLGKQHYIVELLFSVTYFIWIHYFPWNIVAVSSWIIRFWGFSHWTTIFLNPEQRPLVVANAVTGICFCFCTFPVTATSSF